MTERINALSVVLDRDMREDDVTAVIDAISMLRGVLCVTTRPATIESLVAEERAKRELGEKLMAVIWPKDKP